MANLGIVIAVSDYTNDAGNLPACGRDGAAIEQILRHSGRFDNILYLYDETRSTHVKQQLAEFIKPYKSIDIDEVVFYFTGHGEFYESEFYYLLSDYQQRRIKQTALENTELDNIIRSLRPKLFVKIVDACHSGVTYIKNADDFNEYVKSTGTTFSKLYFMFSSQSEQFSYQNDKISYFTESIVKSILDHGASTIRYKDVIDYVSDDFRSMDVQTPFFVVQADYTETFCAITQPLKDALITYVQSDETTALKFRIAEKSIVERLKEDAKRFCTKEEALEILTSIPDKLEQNIQGIEDALEIYNSSVSPEENIPSHVESIGSWIDKNKGEYFADIIKERRTRRVPRRDIFSAFAGLKTSKQEYVEEMVTVIGGFVTTTEMPFKAIKIRLEPKFANVTPEECIIAPILSRTHIRLFWRFSHFEYVDWDSSRPVGSVEWSTDEAELKDKQSVSALTKSIIEKFWIFVKEPLQAKWGPASSPAMSVPQCETGQ